MKKIILFLFMILITGRLSAQSPAVLSNSISGQPEIRTVNGLIKDTADNILIGVSVVLKSDADKQSTTTNNGGTFLFNAVRKASFTLTVSNIGYLTQTRRFIFNNDLQNIVLAPIVLKSVYPMFPPVVINGKPTIIYKEDTMVYIASIYRVQPKAKVAELLKKMDGMEVADNGSLIHQGKEVIIVYLNSKLYMGGDVAKAIKTLRADRVKRIEIIDDYSGLAMNTFKYSDPAKVLNIVTHP